MTERIDLNGYPPRGLNRVMAARWVGVGPTKFDELVADKRMPQPKRVDGRVIWDRYALDAYFDQLSESVNLLDEAIKKSRREGPAKAAALAAESEKRFAKLEEDRQKRADAAQARKNKPAPVVGDPSA